MRSSLLALGGGQFAVGAKASESQLQLLAGMGRDPLTGEPFGRAYPAYAWVAERVEARTAGIDPNLDDEAKAEVVARIEAEGNERGIRRGGRIRLHVLDCGARGVGGGVLDEGAADP